MSDMNVIFLRRFWQFFPLIWCMLVLKCFVYVFFSFLQREIQLLIQHTSPENERVRNDLGVAFAFGCAAGYIFTRGM